MEAAATQQAKQEEVPTSNPPTEVRATPMQPQEESTEVVTSEASNPPNEVMAMAEQPQEETTEVETSEALLTGADASAKATQEVVSAELQTNPRRKQALPAATALPQSRLLRRRSQGRRCIKAIQMKSGKSGGRHKTSLSDVHTSKSGKQTKS